MRFSPSPMLLVATLVAAAAVGAVTPVNAAPVSDIDYMSLSRCAGLSQAMGRADAQALQARLQVEQRGRTAFVQDRAADLRLEAVREVRRAGEDTRRHLTAEADGRCAAYAGPSAVAAR